MNAQPGLLELEEIASLEPVSSYTEDTGEKIAALQLGLLWYCARSSLIKFACAMQDDYQAGWAHTEVAEHLDSFLADVVAQESPRCALTLPPRFGKSRLAVEMFSAYSLGRYPWLDIVVCGYGLSIAQDRTREARELLNSETYARIFDTKLAPDTAAKANWRTRDNGGARGCGIDGPLNGQGAHILIIDDPYKTLSQALSPAYRDAVWSWYRAIAYTRLAPGAGILIVSTRWDEDDLVGRIEQHEQANPDTASPVQRFKIFRYPALAVEDEKHRKKGEALHKERFSTAALKDIRHVLGEYLFGWLYQGYASSSEHSYWPEEYFNLYDALPLGFDQVVLSCDLTFGSKSSVASYVSVQLWGDLDGEAWLISEINGRWTYPEVKDALSAICSEWKPDTLLIEAAAHGHALLQELEADERLQELLGEPEVVSICVGSTAKEIRARATAPRIRAGKVHVPNPETFPDFLPCFKRLTSYPKCKRTDSTDTAGQAIRYITSGPIYPTVFN